MRRKICVVTGSRAEYGLLYWLLKSLQDAPDFELQLAVTGAHLSNDYGLTYRQIEADGFKLWERVEIPLSLNTTCAVSKAIGHAISGFSTVFEKSRPDLLLVLGDRYEKFAAVTAAHVSNIPVAHLHGGESTEGAIDEAFRHSISKMAQLHFVAAEPYRRRVIQLGENPACVFTVGAMASANLHRTTLLSKYELENALDFKFGKKNLLVTFHPETLGVSSPEAQLEDLFVAFQLMADVHLIFTLPNADAGVTTIISMIKNFVAENADRAVWFATLGQQRYLSCLQFVDAVVGNSSSGLIEAPSFKIGTLNIGDRQTGRLKAESVIDCAGNFSAIQNGLQQLFSPEFKGKLKQVQNPYGTADPIPQIMQVLRQTDYPSLLRKSFFDISFQL